MAVSGVVARAAPDEFFNLLDAKVGSPADAAGVAVVDKLLFKERIGFVNDKVMDDAVTDVSGENLPLDGSVDDKDRAIPRFVGAAVDLLP